MVVGVGAGLPVVEVRRWNPFGVAVLELAGDPALFGERVVAAAAERQIIDVGAEARCVRGAMVHLAVVSGNRAAWV